MSFRKGLCADSLIAGIRGSFSSVDDSRFRSSVGTSMVDVLMSGYALFSLKLPSLLALDYDRHDPQFQANMKNLFGVENIPSDTRLREILDEVEPVQLRPAFTSAFSAAQRGKILERFTFLDDRYLLALDGTGYFSSKTVSCDNCLTKTTKNSQETTFYHQMVGAVLIHPDEKVVIPLCPESISGKDGNSKNDCERNAVARWLKEFRKEHPKLRVIITEDGLSSNGPHIRDLQAHSCSFILGAKPGDHKSLFEKFHLAGSQVQETTINIAGITHSFRFINGLPINDANPDLLINLLYYQETSKKGTTTFSWVTDLTLDSSNVFDVMRGGRARWKIENETFNTLKNQGYNFEHNFGHGKKNLSLIFAYLMFLAFAVDQIQLASCAVFQKAKEVTKTFRKLWLKIQSWFENCVVPNWAELLMVIAGKQTAIFPNTT